MGSLACADSDGAVVVDEGVLGGDGFSCEKKRVDSEIE